MSKGLIVGYGDVVERCGDRAIAYAEFAESLGLVAAIQEETLHVDGTRIRIALRRPGCEAMPIPVDVAVAPSARTQMNLPMVVATMQVLAVMAEGVLGTAEGMASGGPEETLTTRRTLVACRMALRGILGESYLLLLDIGAGPELCAEFDDGLHVPPHERGAQHA